MILTQIDFTNPDNQSKLAINIKVHSYSWEFYYRQYSYHYSEVFCDQPEAIL